MARIHVFADESGNFDFTRNQGASTYFILTLISMEDCDGLIQDLHRLRHELAWEGIDHPGPFHAHNDPQPLRERVFNVINVHEFRVDSLIMEKSKAMPHLRSTDDRFYQYAWFYLLKHAAPRVAGPGNELLVVGSALGQKSKREVFYGCIRDVVRQVRPTVNYRTAFWDANCDGCLQVADYCGWAIQRKWERADARAHALISSQIASEYDLFAMGSTHYY